MMSQSKTLSSSIMILNTTSRADKAPSKRKRKEGTTNREEVEPNQVQARKAKLKVVGHYYERET
jgi:hypothetical protein